MKDPAVLFYISDWLTSTAEMDADCRGWYLNLILHNYDKKTLPNDIEKLAVLAGVKFSEYQKFEQVFEQVFKQKFEQVENNRLNNHRVSDIIRDREIFVNKRSEAGKMSYLMRFFAKNYRKEYNDNDLRKYVKDNFDFNIDFKNEQVFKHMFKHLFELYRSGCGYSNKLPLGNLEKDYILTFEYFWNFYDKKVGRKDKIEKKFNRLNDETRLKIIEHVKKDKVAHPDKQFRKNPETYLNNQSWNDEVILKSTSGKNGNPHPAVLQTTIDNDYANRF